MNVSLLRLINLSQFVLHESIAVFCACSKFFLSFLVMVETSSAGQASTELPHYHHNSAPQLSGMSNNSSKAKIMS